MAIDVAPSAEQIVMLRVDQIVPNPHQPRQMFNDESLDWLMTSIQEVGLQQPIVVRSLPDSTMFELIMGERRLRACMKLGLERIAAIVREVDESESAQLAIIENLVREDLDPIDEARAIRQLKKNYKLKSA